MIPFIFYTLETIGMPLQIQNRVKLCISSQNKVAIKGSLEASLQKNDSEAVFLKRGHRAKKCGYSPIWPIAAFYKAA